METSEIYKAIDDYLLWLKENTGNASIFEIDPYSSVGANAVKILKKYSLIHARSLDMSSIIDITIDGLDCIDAGGIENYIKSKQNNQYNANSMSHPFEQFQNDTIRIINKIDGKISNNLKANVTDGIINLYQTDIDVTEGDTIERDLPNGKIEKYLILEATYKEKFMVIEAHYIFKVRKTTALINTEPTNNIYHITGHNARINNNSIDYSSNIVNPDNLFESLREIISTQISENTQLLKLVDDLEINKKNLVT